MTDHLQDRHGVTEKALGRLWDSSRAAGSDWDATLDANHDVLHALDKGQVVRGA